MTRRWQFWIDRGGTFTDIVARAPGGALQTLKLLSENPEQYPDAAVEGVRRMLGLAADELITPARVESVKMGTTVATNALLERRGERTVLVTTRGFHDALRIATQARPRLFDRRIVLPALLYERVIEARERIGADGELIERLDEAALGRDLRSAYLAGIRACAIVFMHGYRFASHERAAETLARAAGFQQVSVSHRVSPLLKLVPRGDTVVVDAYLSPILRRYVDQVAAQMPGVRLLFMQSSGGLTEAGRFRGKDAILSGPAGGIVGMVKTAAMAGHDRLIGFDMGGTSTDVSHYAGHYERAFDTEVAGVRVRAPMMNIHTIAAGGGSLIRFDGARLRVGPESAGANPGPAAYRRGGPLTITDANILLGRIQPNFFPAVFGPRADERLDGAIVAQRFTELARDLAHRVGRPITADEVAGGGLKIAVGSMANAVKRISVARGYDVSKYTLQCFGGAGGQHACLVADALGMERVFCHPLAGVLSAYGMGLADQHVMREASLECELNAEGLAAARTLAARLLAQASGELRVQGVSLGSMRVSAQVRVRYRGTDTALTCALPGAVTVVDAVAAAGTDVAADADVAADPDIGAGGKAAVGAGAMAVADVAADAGVEADANVAVHAGVSAGAYVAADAGMAALAYAADDSRAGAALHAVRAEFEQAYGRRFAFLMPNVDLVLEAVAVECVAGEDPQEYGRQLEGGAQREGGGQREEGGQRENDARDAASTYRPDPQAVVPLYCFADAAPAGRRAAGLYLRDALRPGATLDGPALIVETTATTVVEPGWRACLTAANNLELNRVHPRPAASATGTGVDPVMLEIFNNLFMNIAEQMGLRLQNTAHSVNIKERLDFSCAVFDAAGELIANAPHMPVHLGSMSESIRSVMRRNPAMRPGDVYVLNDPYHGGTHLPDVTVVTPVFLDSWGGRDEVGDSGSGPKPHRVGISRSTGGGADTSTDPNLSGGTGTEGGKSLAASFFVASRGHHADIGGITPGSMPPFSTDIGEEGVLIDNFKLVEAGVLHEAALLRLLQGDPHPARNPAQNLADLRAQIAANEKGAAELKAMVAEYGRETVARYMQHVQDNAEECVRRVITTLRDGRFALRLDNGAEIHVAIRVNAAQRSACIDFTGTSAQLPNNFNAPRAIAVAAVLYVFRTLVDDEIPLNAGCLKPLEIVVPEGCMLNPRAPAAVVAGNVETSTCVTNALYGALGLMASSQCTMNNFTFGNAQYQYYETIAGGSGAGPGFAGTDVVQTHMTNSRLTDPEVLELRFPVRLDSYQIRAGSGGRGRWAGGNGGVRRIRFLEPMTAAILSNGRSGGAFGMAGGGAGAPGENRIERADGRVELLGAIGQAEMAAGDVFVVSTPGGGGYGAAE